jgi:hypothetical protein
VTSQVGGLDRVHDEPAWHPVQRKRQPDRVIQAEPVRAGRPRRPGQRPVQHEPVQPARAGRVGADGVNHDGERRAGPGLDQPGGLTVGEHKLHPRWHPVTQAGYHREAGPVVPAVLVTDADHNHHPVHSTHGLAAGTFGTSRGE